MFKDDHAIDDSCNKLIKRYSNITILYFLSYTSYNCLAVVHAYMTALAIMMQKGPGYKACILLLYSINTIVFTGNVNFHKILI